MNHLTHSNTILPPVFSPREILICQTLAVIAAVVLFAYMRFEVRRWRDPSLAVSPRQKRVRIAGFGTLGLTIALFFLGGYLPTPQGPHNSATLFDLSYLIAILLSVLPLPLLAFLDWRENVKRLDPELRSLQAQRRELQRELLEGIPKEREKGDSGLSE